MTTEHPQEPGSLERALQQARDALADRTPAQPRPTTDARPEGARDDAVERTRAEAREALQKLPRESPARVTRAFSYVLDDLIRVPGTNFRFGVDPLLSFIPAAGTAVGGAFGAVVLVDAVRLRAPLPVLARMVGNYVLDWLVGLVPVLGGFFDMAYRSNAKNLKLLTRTIENRDEVRKASVSYWLVIALMAAVVLLVVIAVPVALVMWLSNMAGTG
ncbi:DUF4112 domain-containing protein [Tessaracoccus sp. OS52]|uniref:DUF4112 domain-containing protein n=1 Tax=Tessaracoccus sp. OS52 TaxID=2886691 RepID=UPI001D12C52B|nr:DUF4112 domain-containing protein [Tessaracoccus sp. OS52]MCC2592191.1 DUF4112 domain-containing protein [Tessaracoccus sp. OS52]